MTEAETEMIATTLADQLRDQADEDGYVSIFRNLHDWPVGPRGLKTVLPQLRERGIDLAPGGKLQVS